MAQSTGPKLIRSMTKGLQCLAEINRHSGLTVSECGALVGLPRTTAFRVLETLCRSGYVYRGQDGSYRATSLVRTLSNGFDDEEWVNDIAMPEMYDLGARLHWSVGIATPNDLTMTIRSTTDVGNPLSLDRFTPGSRLSLAASSPGLVYLANLPYPVRQRLLDACERKGGEVANVHLFGSRAALEDQLDAVAEQGYAQHMISPKEKAVCVPIFDGDIVIGGCGMKYIARAVSHDDLIGKFVPELNMAATRISAKLAERKSMTH